MNAKENVRETHLSRQWRKTPLAVFSICLAFTLQHFAVQAADLPTFEASYSPHCGEKIKALAALSDAGIRAPQDVRIATWANHGNVPIYARALSRVELNPWKDAEATHAFCREILSGKTPGEPPVFAPVWIDGETFTVKCKNQTKGTK